MSMPVIVLHTYTTKLKRNVSLCGNGLRASRRRKRPSEKVVPTSRQMPMHRYGGEQLAAIPYSRLVKVAIKYPSAPVTQVTSERLSSAFKSTADVPKWARTVQPFICGLSTSFRNSNIKYWHCGAKEGVVLIQYGGASQRER